MSDARELLIQAIDELDEATDLDPAIETPIRLVIRACQAILARLDDIDDDDEIY
jgi:hypothetical protein